MLQNVHRGGQGQTLGLANPYELSTSTSSSPSSSPSSTLSSASALLTQQQYQPPTTYRPILRREDQVQVVQAIDYRIPKSLQSQEPLAQQLHRLQSASYPAQSGRSAAIEQYGDDVANLDDATYQERFRSEDGGLPSAEPAASLPAQPPRSRSRLTTEPQPNSYGRQSRFHADRRSDPFVRY